MELNDLLLLSGNDIPFPEAELTIHQPTLKEIAYIGEEAFFMGCEFLNFSKESLLSEDKDRLKNQTDFDIIMSIMRDKHNVELQKSTTSALLVLTLIFPQYKIEIRSNAILLQSKKEMHNINNNNFIAFRNILINMFNITKDTQKEYNPNGDLAKKIAEKLKRGKQQRSANKGQQNKIAVLSRYISILAIGQKKDLNQLMQYTVYQLFDEFHRYQLKTQYDIYLQAKMAGAKDLEEVENWMKDIHSEKIIN